MSEANNNQKSPSEEDSLEEEKETQRETEIDVEETAEEDDILEEEETADEEIEEAEPRRDEEEEKFVEERIFTIPLGRAWLMPPKKRAPKAIRIIRAFISQHMKVGEAAIEIESEEREENLIIISNEVNEKIWSKGIEKPPRKLRVRAAKNEEGNVTIFLA